MDIRILYEFAALGKALSFTEAADKLNVVQSTLSRHVQSIEKELGVTLLDRTSSPVQLTNAGKIFLERSIDIINLHEQMIKDVKAVNRTPQKTYCIGGNLRDPVLLDITRGAVIKLSSLDIDAILYEKHLSASHATLASSDILEDVEEDRVDVALIMAPEDYQWKNLCGEKLRSDPFIILVDKDHPLAHREKLSLSDISHYPVVMMPLHDLFGASIIEACRNAGFEPKTKTYMYESEESMLRSWNDGRILFVPKGLSTRVLPEEVSGLVALDIDDPGAFYTTFIVWKDSLNKDLHDVLDALRTASQ